MLSVKQELEIESKIHVELKELQDTFYLTNLVTMETNKTHKQLEPSGSIFVDNEIQIHLTRTRQMAIALSQLSVNNRRIPLFNSLGEEYHTSLIDRNILITNYFDPTKSNDSQTPPNDNTHQLTTYVIVLIACGLFVFLIIVAGLLFVYRRQRVSLTRTDSTANSSNSLLKQNSTKSQSLSSSTLCSTVVIHDPGQLTIRPATTSTLNSIKSTDNDLNLFIINDLNEFLFIQQSPFEKFKAVFNDLSSLETESTSYVYFDDAESRPRVDHFPDLQTYV